MSKKTTQDKTEEQTPTTSELDKRPWLMDWLMEIGQDLAIINHCNEKLEYISKDIANAETEEEVDELAKKMDAVYDLKEAAYDGYNIKMTFIFDSIPGAARDQRCVLKHGCNVITLAMEVDDAMHGTISEMNLRNAYRIFALSVSIALGFEFTDCIRCIYDGVKTASDKAVKSRLGKEIKRV